MKIAIGCDHTALDLKLLVAQHLREAGHEVRDFGTHTLDSCDYPTYGEAVARAIVAGECERGVLICGTGIGISLAANKVKGIRAAACSEPVSARLAREHNNAQIICFGARIVGSEMAKAIIDAYLNAHFEAGRHQRRVDMIMNIEG